MLIWVIVSLARKYDIGAAMLQLDLIREFLNYKSIAVIGVSRKGDIPANYIFQKFKKAGYNAIPINPNTDELEGEKCYPDLMSIPEKPDVAFFAGSPEVSNEAIKDVIALGLPIVWMHRGIGKGSYSKSATEEARNHGVSVIENGCPMMFVEKVDGFHKLLRWFKKF